MGYQNEKLVIAFMPNIGDIPRDIYAAHMALKTVLEKRSGVGAAVRRLMQTVGVPMLIGEKECRIFRDIRAKRCGYRFKDQNWSDSGDGIEFNTGKLGVTVII